jgi:hypothetical protein
MNMENWDLYLLKRILNILNPAFKCIDFEYMKQEIGCFRVSLNAVDYIDDLQIFNQIELLYGDWS